MGNGLEDQVTKLQPCVFSTDGGDSKEQVSGHRVWFPLALVGERLGFRDGEGGCGECGDTVALGLVLLCASSDP